MLRNFSVLSSIVIGLASGAAWAADPGSVVGDFAGSELTVTDLNCEGGWATVEGKIGNENVTEQNVSISSKVCEQIQTDFKKYSRCSAGRTDKFEVLKYEKNNYYLYNTHSYEIVKVEPATGPTKEQYCVEKPKNFRQISPTVYAGGRLGAEELNYLKSLHIAVIVNLQGGNRANNPLINSGLSLVEPGESVSAIAREQQAAKELGIDFKNLPMTSFWMSPENLVSLDSALNILNTSTQPVYLHCENGVDRTGLVASIYRVETLHQPVDEVLKDWTTLRKTRWSERFTVALPNYFRARDRN